MAFLIAAACFVAIWLAYQLLDYRRRRLLYSSWRRFWRWEFWPMSAFYPPIAVFVILLGVRYRSLTLFTLANPGIPHAGMAMNSKSGILYGFRDARERIAAFTVIECAWSLEEQGERLRRFMSEKQLRFPIALKPDFGERGIGVSIVGDFDEAMHYLKRNSENVIAQEYVPGDEFGIFYIRRPSQEKGRVSSITSKLPTSVTGDGVRSLEQLILDDDRAVCMARFFRARFADRLSEVPASGERVVLAELGTHSRGALFLDADDIWTEALEASFDRLSKSFEGFFVGRYDVRVESLDAFRRGEGFKVLELNGVLSEPTHMYDPKHSLLYAWKTMFRLWSEIFEISAENRANGFRPSTFAQLTRLFREFRAQNKLEV